MFYDLKHRFVHRPFAIILVAECSFMTRLERSMFEPDDQYSISVKLIT